MAEPAVHDLVKAELGVEVVWRAFELRPEPVPTLDPKGDYLQRVWGNSVYPLAESMGIAMKLPPLQPRSRPAHESAQWARLHGHFDDYNAAIFRAFFERGEDIGDIEILASLAMKLDLPGDSLRHALESGEFQKSVLEDERLAQTLGVSGVPAFVANRRVALSGVQSVANLKKLVEHVRA
ncbi:MAG: DsbA family oxidoreductase [Pyrinomonadaceae bacterium]